MQLTLFTDYCIRSLILVSTRSPGQLTTITEIADKYELSRNHVVKVVHRLGQLGYLHTQRGKNGGVKLARPANEILMGTLIRDVEPHHSLMNCSAPHCCLSHQCRMKSILAKAIHLFYNELDLYTLADIIKEPEEVYEILNIDDEYFS
ncbi:Rrf2 family transcriptional regulator [Celerinatantimonas diazotrophica]|uniref:BadM/Rrf2 family transcriptional regulator n=1 Tax=Celerinatantimonas diazotrophica TaxID=412034 RepID=A0A4R1J8E4_9GAMM|nr:Rrf2 family transcriptional regulator [Celerinatantimonas diazotrophica]TCK46316.1 BadM/Rrf2 family transcriptional regulator [Celerinatantimonas diazotrophica]CAG9295310.1 HTH-type transcriptional repressor NsrR [Celerinatantimonas diazotrophica]